MDDWDQIIREHGPMVWRTLYRILNHDTDARDCYQEVFVQAWQVASRSSVSNWSGLLKQIATRRAIDRLRSRYRQGDRCDPTQIDRLISTEAGPDDRAAARELVEQLRHAVTGLPEKQAEAFWLRCVEQQPAESVAEQMRIEPGHVRVLIHRARVRLREVLCSSIQCGSSKAT